MDFSASSEMNVKSIQEPVIILMAVLLTTRGVMSKVIPDFCAFL